MAAVPFSHGQKFLLPLLQVTSDERTMFDNRAKMNNGPPTFIFALYVLKFRYQDVILHRILVLCANLSDARSLFFIPINAHNFGARPIVQPTRNSRDARVPPKRFEFPVPFLRLLTNFVLIVKRQ